MEKKEKKWIGEMGEGGVEEEGGCEKGGEEERKVR